MIRLMDVSQTFTGRSGSVEALRGLNLDIRDGEFIAVVGRSGCGKSTLLRIMAGLLRPTHGQVVIGGDMVIRPRRDVSMMFQRPALLPWRSVLDNVLLPVEIFGWKRRAHLARAMHLLHMVGLDGFAKRRPHELSGGMQQRVSLVRGFALGAPILLMDEPFAALDEITRAEMRYLLLDLWQRTGTTVVFVTHSITEAVILSDRVVMMAARPGRIAAVEPISLGRPRLPEMEDAPEFHEHVRVLRDHLQDHHA
jgi:NitT/TauT family transport system ATP-binding protein